jgi:cytochrome c5
MASNNDKQHQDKHDQHFYDTFMLVLGILVAFAIGMYYLANSIAEATPGAYEKGSVTEEQLIDQRLASTSDVQISGDSKTQMAAPAPAASAGGAPKSGKDLWQGTCSGCHGTGVLGAPKIGDKAAWAPRIKKGMDVLKDHALHGFNQMPAHGGNASLSDADVAAALEYMVDQSK